MPSPLPRLRNRSLAVLLLCLLPLAATSATAQQSGDGTLRLDRPGGETLVSGTAPDGRSVAGAPATLDFGTLGTFTLGAGASVTLEFDVMVNPAIPAGVSMVANQGSVGFDQAPMALPTDDPTTGMAGDPTVTQLLVEAELGVTKTDNPASATAVPGNAIQYVVGVSNAGSFGVLDVPVTDTFPPSLTGCTWACGGTGNCDAANGMGNIATTVDLMAGQSVAFVISCTVDPSATGMLANTGSAAVPMGVSDPGVLPNSATDTNTLTPQGDLSATKVTNTSPVVAGAAIQYTVTVANSGPSDAVGVDVTDNLPASITSVTWTCAGADCPNANGMGDIAETANLGAGNNIVYTVNGTVDAGAGGSISNTASLTVPAGFTDTTPGNESDTVMDSLNAEGDVAVAKTTLTSPVIPGAAVQWQIAVTNAGPSDALGVTLTDTFPATVTGVTWTCAASAGSACSAAMGAGNLNESIDVAAGGNVTYTATGTVDANATGNLVNTASVTPPMGFTDGSTGNDDSTTMDALVPQGNLSITKSTLTSPVVAGNAVQYQIVVANSGPSTAVGATVQDNFAAELSNESWTCVASAGSSCTAAGMGDVLDMVTLLPGGTATYTVTADLAPTATGTLMNTATVTAPAGFTDTNGGDNSFQVNNAITVQADLVVSKDDGGGMVLPGDPITYTIVVTNQGPSNVNGVAVTDLFPPELSNVTWTCMAAGGATCTAGPVMGDLNDVVNLPAGGSVTYTATADTPNAPGMVTNTASATLPRGAVDPTPDDAEDAVTTNVGRLAVIPTLSTAGFALLALLLAGLGLALLRRRGRGAVAGLALLLALGLAGAADAQVLVDDFSTAQVLTADPPTSPPPMTSLADGAGILGGERDLAMRLISGAGPVTGEVTGGLFAFDVPAATRGEAEITWDGNDNDAGTLDPTGLPNVDLTDGGTQSGFALLFDAADAGLEIILRVYTDGSNYSQAGRLVTTAIAAPTPVFIPFAELRPVAGSGADPSDVGAIVLVLRGDGVSAADLLDLSTGGPNLTITKVDLDPNTNTEIGNTPVAAGSTIRYRITVQNSGGDATTVDVNDMAPANTTLLPNTLNSTPAAAGDAYNWFGNVTLTVDGGAFPTLLANDTDPDGDPITITAFDAATPQGGTVSMVNVMTGAFTYLPPAGFNGIDSFTYTIQDDDGNAASATATILLEQSVWFVDSDRCAFGSLPCGTGTQADPFGSLIQAEVASAAGDVIRLRKGTNDATHYAQGIILKPSQRLIGEGVDLVLGGVHIEGLGTADGNLDPNPANRPAITNTSMGGEGLTLASGVTVLGLNVVGASDSAVFGTGVDAVTLDHVAVVDSGGAALEVTNSTNLSLTFTGLDSLTSIEDAVLLDTVTGSLTVNGTTQLDNPAGAGIRMINSPGFVASFAAVNVVDAGGGMPHPALELTNNAGASFTFGALNLDSENGPGLLANNGGIVNHPSSGNVINAVGGAAVDIQSTTGNAGGSPGWSFDSLTSAGSPNTGVRLVSLAQDFNVGMGGTTVVNPDTTGILVQNSGAGTDYDFGATSVTDTNVGMGATADGIDIATGNSMATFTFDSLDVLTDGGFGLLANNSGTVTIGGAMGNTLIANGGAALNATSTTVGGSGWIFDTLSSANSPSFGINLVSMTGIVTGKAGSITGAAGTAFNVDMGAPVATYSGSVTQNAAQRVVNVEDTTGGSVTFNTGTVTGGASSLGVRINNADGNASFADLDLGTSVSRMTNQALTLSGGSTGTFSFAGTQIFTTGAQGVNANNGGTVQFTGAGNRVDAVNARALTFEGGTTIGAMGATFLRIDASGADRGIRLSSAGSGFTVTGSGSTDGSGGTIQNITQRGIEVLGTNAISLANMTLTSAATTDAAGMCDNLVNTGCHAAVHLGTVDGATLNNVDVNGSTQIGVNGSAVNALSLVGSSILNAGSGVNEGCLQMFGLTGTSLINNSDIGFPSERAAYVNNENAANLDLTVNGSTFRDTQSSGTGADGLELRFLGTSTAAIDVVNSFFRRNRTNGLQVIAEDTTSVGIDVTGSIFDREVGIGIGVNLAANDSASLTFNVIGNPLINSRGGTAVNVFTNLSAVVNGRINDNPDIQAGGPMTSGSGIVVQVNEDSRAIVEIANNTVSNVGFDAGIQVIARGKASGACGTVCTAGRLDATIDNNDVTVDSGGLYDVWVQASDDNTTCANVTNNAASAAAIAAFRERTAAANSTVLLEGFNTDAATTWSGNGNTPAAGPVSASNNGTLMGGTCTAVSHPLP